jgi:hypothetical protein
MSEVSELRKFEILIVLFMVQLLFRNQPMRNSSEGEPEFSATVIGC